MKTLTIIVLFFFALTGCASTNPLPKNPTAEELAKMDYGKPPTVDYQQSIKDYCKTFLKDPDSAQYQFQSEPKPFWFRDSIVFGSKEYTGYAVLVLINSKNGYGGYNGFRKYAFIFKNDQIIKAITPDDFEMMQMANSFKQ